MSLRAPVKLANGSVVQERGFEGGANVRAAVCLGKERSITDYLEENNVFGSHYHVREPRTRYSSMAFSSASQHLSQWNERGIFIKVALEVAP